MTIQKGDRCGRSVALTCVASLAFLRKLLHCLNNVAAFQLGFFFRCDPTGEILFRVRVMIVPVLVERRRDLQTEAVRVVEVDAEDHSAAIGRSGDVDAVASTSRTISAPGEETSSAIWLKMSWLGRVGFAAGGRPGDSKRAKVDPSFILKKM